MSSIPTVLLRPVASSWGAPASDSEVNKGAGGVQSFKTRLGQKEKRKKKTKKQRHLKKLKAN